MKAIFLKPILGLNLLLLFVFSAFHSQATEIEILSYAEFEKRIKSDKEGTVVYNFWATWCKPCVEELPFFDSIAAKYKNEKLKVLLVSIDFESALNKRVLPFIANKNVQSEVLIFDDPAQHKWIPKIDKNWSGAIPATYIYKGKRSAFYEKSFTQQELENVVKPFIN